MKEKSFKWIELAKKKPNLEKDKLPEYTLFYVCNMEYYSFSLLAHWNESAQGFVPYESTSYRQIPINVTHYIMLPKVPRKETKEPKMSVRVLRMG